MSNEKKMSMQRLAVILGILILPLCYSFFYLKAFWDPYKTLDDVPVAIVNLDEGALINDKKMNLGDEVEKALKENDVLKFVITDKEDAYDGLLDQSYYATITIPKDFSEKIGTMTSDEKMKAKIIYAPNEKSNYLASQILSKAVLEIEAQIRSNITKEIVTGLVDQLDQVPSSLEKMKEGVITLSDGSKALLDGSSTLQSGLQMYVKQYKTFDNAVLQLQKGVNQLQNGMSELSVGKSAIVDGAQELVMGATKLDELSQGMNLLNEKVGGLTTGVSDYTDGVNELIDNYKNLATLLSNYVAAHPDALNDSNMQALMQALQNPDNAAKLQALKDGGVDLNQNVSGLQQAVSTLNDGASKLPSLKTGLLKLQRGVSAFDTGFTKIQDGMDGLSDGMLEAKGASTKLLAGLDQLTAGSSQLEQGISTLHQGHNTMLSELTSKIDSTKNELKRVEGLADYAADPVETETEAVEPVPNYGTAFAPYFMSLSLWVAGIMLFVVIYVDRRFKLLSKDSEKPFVRTCCYLGFGVVEGILLGFILHHMLGLEIANGFLYYFGICLVSVTFITIIQFFMVHLKDIGKFIVMLLLILQLTSCGGTFPMETVPKMFNVLYPFMPMTYSVGLFKDAISGTHLDMVAGNILVLVSLLVFFTAITIILSNIEKKHMKHS